MRRDEARSLIRELAHATDYNPEERRAYYLRTRKLKGREGGAKSPANGSSRLKFSTPTSVKTRTVVTKNDAAGRQASIQQRVAKLTQRLDELKKKLESVREKARKKDDAKSSDKKSSSTSDSKDQKPLTSAEKRKKAEREKDRYDKEEKNKQPETEEEILTEIRKVESNIRAVLSAARNKPNQTDS